MSKRWLIIILIIASIFRFVGLTKSPPSLNWDEVSIGYNAYSIFKTGKDEWGNFMPLSFKAFGEQKLPGFIYASIPGIAIFGLNDFGVRFTPALIGVITVYLVYLLATRLLNDKKYGLYAAFLLSISPWHIHFSRSSFEAGLALALTVLGIYFLLLAKNAPKYYIYASLVAVLGAYTYNSVRILLPLLLIAYATGKFIVISGKTRKHLIIALVLGILLAIPIGRQMLEKDGLVRWGTLSVASQKSFVDDISESRGYTTLPSIIPRLIHNKVTHYVYKVFINYINTFSTEFLFLQGSTNTQRSVQGLGLLYLFELPLLVIGLSKLRKFDGAGKVLIPLVLLAPIPSALTIDAPSSVRSLAMLPGLVIIEAIAVPVVTTWLRSKSKFVVFGVLVFALWNISYFSYKLWLEYPVKYADAWGYGHRQAMEYVFSNYDKVDRIYITSKYGEPHIYALFYGRVDPAKYQQMDIKYSVDPLGWIHVESFDKFHFTGFTGLDTPDEIVARTKGSNLLVTGFATLPGSMPRTLEIKAPNWKVMFEGTIVKGQEK